MNVTFDARDLPILHDCDVVVAAFAGCNPGKDAAGWQAWLAEHEDGLAPAPWGGSTDAVASWDEEVLTDACR
jgi:hypothetical protein